MAEIEIKDQKHMMIIGIVVAVLIVYSAFFANMMPYSITQYLGYSFIKLLLFIIIAVVTHASPVVGIVLLISVLSTYQYFYVQSAFRNNLVTQRAKRIGRKIKESAKNVAEDIKNAMEDEENEAIAEIKEEMSSTGQSYAQDNSYFMTSDNSRMQNQYMMHPQQQQQQLRQSRKQQPQPNPTCFDELSFYPSFVNEINAVNSNYARVDGYDDIMKY